MIKLGWGVTLTLVLIILKALEIISIPWVLVFIPAMISAFVLIVSGILGIVIAAIIGGKVIEGLKKDLDKDILDEGEM